MVVCLTEQSRASGHPARLGRLGRAVALGALLSGVLGSLPTGAAALSLGSVQVPAGCGSEQELRDGLRDLVGDAAGTEPAVDLEIRSSGEHGPYELRVQVGGERRVLRDADCQTLFRSGLVMLAAAAGAEATPALASQPTAAIGEAPQAAHGDQRGRAGAHARASIALGGGAVLGVVPDFGARFDLQASAEWGHFGAQFGGHYLAPSSTDTGASQVAARVSGYGLRAGVLAIPVPALRFMLGVELSYLRASSVQVIRTGDGGALTLALVLEATARVLRFGSGYVDLALAGQWALSRPQFEVRGAGAVYRQAPLGAALLARLGWSIF